MIGGMRRIFRRSAFVFLVGWSTPIPASPMDAANICESSAQAASQATGVPLDVLRAITLTETGRRSSGKLRPWPWTVNMEGAGRWFEDRQSAHDFVMGRRLRGAESFDVGCFQINYKWHGKAFRDIEHMFDPSANAHYAARFLAELYSEFGDWTRAAGAYHSRTPKYAKRYRERFARLRKTLSPVPPVATAEVAAPLPSATDVRTPNRFPLLRRVGGTATFASLVPLHQTPDRRLIDISGQ